MLAFIAVLVFKLLSRELLKSRLLFKKIANFTGKLLQNYKFLECEIYQCFFNLHDDTFKAI